MNETRYYASGGKVYAVLPGGVEERGTALTADGRDLERFDRALDKARRQREQRAAEQHYIGTSTRKLGGSPIRGGGTYRCSEVYCSCGWEERQNGQTYAESMQAAREHLKEMGVYNTQGEQTIFAHMSRDYQTVEEIAEKSGKTVGLVQKAVNKFVARGTASRIGDTYAQTDKWFSWND